MGRWVAVLVNRFPQQAYGGFGLSCGRQQTINCLALLIDRPIIILPLAFYFEIRFIHSPARADTFLLLSKGRIYIVVNTVAPND